MRISVKENDKINFEIINILHKESTTSLFILLPVTFEIKCNNTVLCIEVLIEKNDLLTIVSACKEGYFGEDCELKCSDTCMSSCNTFDGTCIGGCKGHFTGDMCQSLCSPNCQLGCLSGSICLSGLCNAGFSGNECTTGKVNFRIENKGENLSLASLKTKTKEIGDL